MDTVVINSITSQISSGVEPHVARSKNQNGSNSFDKLSYPAIDDAVTIDLTASMETETTKNADALKETEGEPSAKPNTLLDLEAARKKLFHQLNNTEIKFDVTLEHNGTSGVFFQVVEKETGKVIRQFPPEELSKLERFDERA